MKRLIVILFLCFISFCANAKTSPEEMEMQNALAKVHLPFYDNTVAKLSLTLRQKYYKDGLSSWLAAADEMLSSYIDPKDLEYIMEHSEGIYVETEDQDRGNAVAYFNPYHDFIALTYSSYKDIASVTKESIKEYVHHETQHLKDADTLEMYGYGKEAIGMFMDEDTQIIHSIIMEARAYSEEAVFVYEKMIDAAHDRNEDEYKRWLDLYSNDSNPAKPAFKKAIEAGKSVEEARHIAAIALLNSSFFAEDYFDQIEENQEDPMYMLARRAAMKRENVSYDIFISADTFLGILDDGKFTKEDLYAPLRFWLRYCRGTRRNSAICVDVKLNYLEKNGICTVDGMDLCEKYEMFHSKLNILPNTYSDNFKTKEFFKKIDQIFNADKVCGQKKRIFTTPEEVAGYDKNYFKLCCTLDWDFGWLYGAYYKGKGMDNFLLLPEAYKGVF